MKKTSLCLLMGLSLLMACSKENIETLDVRGDVYIDDIQHSFAKILSEAVSENLCLRSFIKANALEQFDYDYDVFYPFVKDKEVESGKTFRDILLQYCSEEELSHIETNFPKLNILVPDWAWIGCFSVNSWDVSSDRVAVSYVSQNNYVELFENGKSLGTLPAGSFPNFPVLIIKSNERINYTPTTRSGDEQYSFIDEAFRNIQTKVEHRHETPTIDGTPDISNFVPASQINYRAKQAYTYFPAGANSIYQRDYLYYNMTGAGQEKVLYSNIWEKLYKFKFNSFNISSLFDDKVGNVSYDIDKSNLNKKWEYKKNDSPKTAAELKSYFYAEGNLELVFQINIPTNGGANFTTQKTKSVSFADVFAIDHADLDYRHRTWLCRDWYVYTIDINAIKPKWCILDWQLPKWDISTSSSIITVNVTEFDETGDREFTYTTKRTVANNFKVEGSAEFGSSTKWKVGLGYNNTVTNENSTSEKFTRTQGGVDNLGQAELEYITPVLLRQTTKNGISGYEVYTVTTGNVDLMFLPFSY